MLTKIDVTITFTGDAVNSNSTFFIAVQFPQDHAIGDHQIAHTGIQDNDTITRTLNLRDNTLTAEQIPSSVLYLQIDSPGHDRAYGNPSASFTFSDGRIISATYQPFRIANHNGESNNTHQHVIG